MQEKKARRSNAQRTELTRQALIVAARRLFAERGYADTSTPDIVEAAGVTRGALYHHFKDKAQLFHAVLSQEAAAVAKEIEARTSTDMAPVDALAVGADAYFDAMSVPGRARMLLIDGAAALGHGEIRKIELATGGEELRQGLAHLLNTENAGEDPIVLADLLSAMFDRAALAISMGEDAAAYRHHMKLMLGLLADMRGTTGDNAGNSPKP